MARIQLRLEREDTQISILMDEIFIQYHLSKQDHT
jgi:hypothetical protein